MAIFDKTHVLLYYALQFREELVARTKESPLFNTALWVLFLLPRSWDFSLTISLSPEFELILYNY